MKRRFIPLIITVLMCIMLIPINASAVPATINDRISGDTRFETAVEISKYGWESSDYVFLTYSHNFPDALAAVPLAYDYNAPILLTGEDSVPDVTMTEIKRLGAHTILILGGTATVAEDVAQALTAEGLTVERLQGDSRFGTAISIGDRLFERASTPTDTAVIAYAYNFPDALSMGVPAALNGWPILFTDSAELNSESKAALLKWGIKKCFIAGGTSVVYAAVADEIEAMGITVERIAGDDRFKTSEAIARRFFTEPTDVFVATGRSFPDALTGGVLASLSSAPMLLTDTNEMPQGSLDYIGENIISGCHILGGESAVGPAVPQVIEPKLTPNPYVNIPDEVLFEKLIEAGWDTSGDGKLTYAEMAVPTVLELYYSDITDLTGLENATGLETLMLPSTGITTIAPLKDLTNVSTLSIRYCSSLSDYSQLASMTGLRTLYIGANATNDISVLPSTGVTELHLYTYDETDLSPVLTMTNLTSLSTESINFTNLVPIVSLTNLDELALNYGKITDVTMLSPMTWLKTLNLDNNSLVNLIPLGALTGLESLSVSYQKDANNEDSLVSVSGLELLTALKHLSLAGNYRLDVVGAISGLTSLEELDMSGSGIRNLNQLTSLIGLTSLDLNGVKATSTTGLQALVNLTYLDIGNCYINDVSYLAPLVKLKYLDIEGNRNISNITALANMVDLEYLSIRLNNDPSIMPLAGLHKLEFLDISDNDVSSLIVLANMEYLVTVRCQQNAVSDLTPLSGLTNLKDLDLWQNNISDITPLSSCTALEKLSLNENNVTNLAPLSGLSNLYWLQLRDNNVSNLAPLATLSNLERLEVGNNNLENLNGVTGLDKLWQLDVNNNKLTDISALSGMKELTQLTISYNNITSISAIENISTLYSLTANNNRITDPSPMAGLNELRGVYLQDNDIADISSISDMSWLRSIRLLNNYLDINDGSDDMQVIEALQAAGVDVYYDPQKTP